MTVTVKYSATQMRSTFLSSEQWGHIKSNIHEAWDNGYTGKGITIMIVEFLHGVDKDHPDLSNLDTSISRGISGTPYVPGKEHWHPTAVATIAAGTGTKYITGVAYNARLGSSAVAYESDMDASKALVHAINAVDIYSNSRTIDVPGPYSNHMRPLSIGAMKYGAIHGRKGKGAIYTYASGNLGDEGGQTAYSPLLNIHEVIAVGAITKMGYCATYNTPGTAILVSGPGGLDSSPNTGPGVPAGRSIYRNTLPYTLAMNGTSAACPHISGVIALMLQARPSLTWRDIQHILTHSSRQTDVAIEYVANHSGLLYSRDTGYGVPDASKACSLSRRWIPLSTMHIHTVTHRYDSPIPLPTVATITYDQRLSTHAIECVILAIEVTGDEPIGIRISSPTTDYVTVVKPIPISEYEGRYTLQVGMKCEAFRDDPIYVSGKPWRISIEEGSGYYLNALSLEVHSYDTIARKKVPTTTYKDRRHTSIPGYSGQVSNICKCE